MSAPTVPDQATDLEEHLEREVPCNTDAVGHYLPEGHAHGPARWQFTACGLDGATIAEAASWDQLDEPTREILREGVRALLGLDPAPANTIMVSGDTAWIRWLTRTVAQHPEELDPERLALVEIPEFPTLDPYVGANLETVQVLRQDEDQPWGVHPRVGWLDGPYTPDEARRIGAEPRRR